MARQRNRWLLRLLDARLPLSILLIDFVYYASLMSRGGMPPTYYSLEVAAYFGGLVGGLAVIASSIAGVIAGSAAAILNRSWYAGRIFFAWSFIGTFVGSITGGVIGGLIGDLIGDWFVPLKPAPKDDIGAGDFTAWFIYLYAWLFAIIVGFIWGCICANNQTRRRKSSMLSKPSP